MNAFLLVGLGGALGAMARHAVGRGATSLGLAPAAWPWATFAVNVGGGFALGLVAGWLAFRGGTAGAEPLRLFLGVGLLGGFTTFSAFSLELLGLLQRGQHALALGYALASVLLSVAALAAGLALARGLG